MDNALPLQIQLEMIKSKFKKTLSEVIMEYNLPASIYTVYRTSGFVDCCNNKCGYCNCGCSCFFLLQRIGRGTFWTYETESS